MSHLRGYRAGHADDQVILRHSCDSSRFRGDAFGAGYADEVSHVSSTIHTTRNVNPHHHAGIDPDIICVGKSLSAGYVPISAALVKDEIYQTFGDQPEDHTLYHGHTFAGNPIAAAAALETLAVFRDEEVISNVQALGPRLEKAMTPIRDLPGVMDVRTLGLIAAVELDSDEKARSVQTTLLDARILTRPLGRVIYLMPPLTIPETSLLDLVSALHGAISKN